MRWWNVRTPERYIAAVEAGRSPEAGREVLDDRAARLRGALARRCARPAGVPWDALERPDELDGLVDARDGDRAVLTVRGRLLANEVSTQNRLR